MPFLFFVSLVFFDQLSKYIVRQWGGFYICNKGIAFGIEIPQIWIWIFILIFLIILLILTFKLKVKISNLGLALILSGAFSNMIDRFYFGCIIDFINIPFWPAIFNLADVFIIASAIIILIDNFKLKISNFK